MAINFNELPQENAMAFTLPPKGKYFATIEVAEMKQGKDTTKPPYLNLRYGLKDNNGKSFGKLFDIITEPNHEITRFKLRRFIEALEIPMEGSFELKDLTKIVVGKTFIADVGHDTKDPENTKAVINVFSEEIFYPMAEAGNIFGNWVDPSSETIQAPDADDVIASEY